MASSAPARRGRLSGRSRRAKSSRGASSTPSPYERESEAARPPQPTSQMRTAQSDLARCDPEHQGRMQEAGATLQLAVLRSCASLLRAMWKRQSATAGVRRLQYGSRREPIRPPGPWIRGRQSRSAAALPDLASRGRRFEFGWLHRPEGPRSHGPSREGDPWLPMTAEAPEGHDAGTSGVDQRRRRREITRGPALEDSFAPCPFSSGTHRRR